MNWIDVAGGIGQGVSGGLQDIRQMQEQALRKKATEQQMRLQQQQIDENNRLAGIREGMKGIKAPGTEVPVDGVSSQDAAESGGTLQAATKSKKVSKGDYHREAAQVMTQGGDYEGATKAMAAAKGADTDDKRTAVLEKYRGFLPMVDQDPVGFLTTYAPEWYKKMVPDGHHAAVQTTPNGLMVSVYDEKTNKMIHQRAIPPAMLQAAAHDTMQKMYLYEMGLISPEDFRTSFEMGLKQQDANAKTLTAQSGAAYHGAQGDELRNRIATGNYGQQQYNRDHGVAALTTANATAQRVTNEGNRDRSDWSVIGTDEKGNPVQQDKRSGIIRVGSAPDGTKLNPKVTGAKQQPELHPEFVKTAYREYENAGNDPKRQEAVKKKYPGVDFGGGKKGVDPVIQALKDYDPNKGATKKDEPKKEDKAFAQRTGARGIVKDDGEQPKGKAGIKVEEHRSGTGARGYRPVEED